MACTLLFCISEEAKAFAREALDARLTPLDEEDGPRMFYLVESRDGPQDGQRFKMELRDDETFETDFISATPEECQRWADERRRHDLSFHDGIIAIIDARSAKDGTLLMQVYAQYQFPFGDTACCRKKQMFGMTFECILAKLQRLNLHYCMSLRTSRIPSGTEIREIYGRKRRVRRGRGPAVQHRIGRRRKRV